MSRNSLLPTVKIIKNNKMKEENKNEEKMESVFRKLLL